MIELQDVIRTFGPRRALAGVNLRIAPGEFVALLGPNGAGKTTLLRILATLNRPTSGTVRIAGLDTSRASAEVRRQIGYLSHRTLLYEDLTAEQNLAFYARMYDLDRDDAEARITALLAQVNLSARRYDLVRTYSRGMQQRLAVARAVLHRPRLLLLDEPYTGLDPLASEALTTLLAELAEVGCTVLLTTHHLESAIAARGRVVVLHHGRIVHDAHDVGPEFPARYRALVTGEAAPVIPPPTASPPATTPAAREPAPPTSAAQPRPFYHKIWAIFAKDIAAELHTREIFNAMFVFAVLAMLIFSFALDLRGDLARAAAPGVLWATIAFAGTLGLSRSMSREQQSGGLEGLLLTPVDRALIFSGKALGNLAMMAAVELVLLPLATVLFDVPLLNGGVLLVMLLGTTGYAAVGTLLAAIAVNTRAREVMLPILLLPLTVPLLIGAVQATRGLVEGLALAEVGNWTQLLVVYTLIIVAVSMVTFGYVVEE